MKSETREVIIREVMSTGSRALSVWCAALHCSAQHFQLLTTCGRVAFLSAQPAFRLCASHPPSFFFFIKQPVVNHCGNGDAAQPEVVISVLLSISPNISHFPDHLKDRKYSRCTAGLE